ncbi:EAL domain-containing protein [Achromobacter denitrificans]|uniref:EAL domain-containing protein n=1 Tax=Achromobacter denitrificans TaxID=32002 RepID=UPI0023E85EFD|nr:EAL domain-containing protein [Achromobacter denitrificans]MDF3858149.1 EAL domain-containing protein [Achromobacter denitrificans]
MPRKYVIGIAIAFAAAAALLPIGFALHMSWSRAVAVEQRDLQGQAERTLKFTQGLLDQTVAMLRTLNDVPFEPCSPQHIRHLRALALKDRAVDELAYVAGRVVKCTTWGVPSYEEALVPTQYLLSNGGQLVLDAVPVVSPGIRMVAVRYGDYSALLEPGRFTEKGAADGVQLAVVLPGVGMLGTRNHPDLVLVSQALNGGKLNLDEAYLSAVARNADLAVVLLEPQSEALGALRRERLFWLPMGALAAALMIGLVVWLSRRRLSLAGELAAAVRRREFVVHYQPIIDLRSGRCVGAEALIRWIRPGGKTLRPDLFISIAEENGLMTRITEEVFRLVIRDMEDLLAEDRGMHIAVNLSAGDLKDGKVLRVLQEMLESTAIDARQIWLEATERGFMDVDKARCIIEQAREQGHAVAIDDFGTGYSSLSYLQRLPLDTLKIDKSFVDTIGTDSATHKVTDHIIDMAKSLNLLTVAEGIERQEQADHLKNRNVDFGQGWLFGKPMPAPEFILYYRKNAATTPPPQRLPDATA